MGIPWSSIALASAAGTFAVVHLGPAYSIHSTYHATFPLLYLTLLLSFAVWKVILYPYCFSPLRHLPQPSGNSIFNGQFGRIFNEPTCVPHQDWINDIPNDGLIYYRSLLNNERLMPTTPQALKEVLTEKSYDFIKPPALRHGLGRLLGKGLVLAEGEEHRVQRKNLMPAFSFRHVKDLYPTFWSKSALLVNKLMADIQQRRKESPESEPIFIDIAGWASRATLDIIGTAGLGKDFKALDDPDTELNLTYRKVLQPTRMGQFMAFASLVVPHKLLRLLPVSHNNNVEEGTNSIKRVARELIREKRQKLLEEGKRQDIDILSVAIESGGFSDEDLVNQLMTFLAAGHETTATGLTWAIYLLCKSPDVQSRLRKEVKASLPSPDSEEQMTVQTLDSCAYLHAVCNEVLRLYAPVPMTLRVSAKDTTIAGHFVPKGTDVMTAIWAVNTSVRLWGDDAAKFNPDRWMGLGKAGNGGAESAYAFMTFIHGPRSCIGQRFANAEFACLVAALIGRFEFALEKDDTDIKIKGGITAKPKDGLSVKIKPLEGW